MPQYVHKIKTSAILKDLWKQQSSFFVIFIKKNGSKRLMHAKYGVKKNLKGGINHTQQPKFPYSTVYDLEKRAYRTLNMDTVLAIITKEGDEYIINQKEEADTLLVPLPQSEISTAKVLRNDPALQQVLSHD